MFASRWGTLAMNPPWPRYARQAWTPNRWSRSTLDGPWSRFQSRAGSLGHGCLRSKGRLTEGKLLLSGSDFHQLVRRIRHSAILGLFTHSLDPLGSHFRSFVAPFLPNVRQHRCYLLVVERVFPR